MEPYRRTVGQAAWQLEMHEQTASTNDLARRLSAWQAVRAEQQTAGRGRFGRSFVSDSGGHWISAVVPATGGPLRWTGFSLMVGCHLLRLLSQLGVPAARLRWPNDLMCGGKKLGGILIEQAPGVLIVGLGLNVQNAPWQHDTSLADTTTRLNDLIPRPLDLEDLDPLVLDAIANAHAAMQEGGFEQAIREFNAHWSQPHLVEITLLEGETIRGDFGGLDAGGNLLVGGIIVPHNQVGRLREI